MNLSPSLKMKDLKEFSLKRFGRDLDNARVGVRSPPWAPIGCADACCVRGLVRRRGESLWVGFGFPRISHSIHLYPERRREEIL